MITQTVSGVRFTDVACVFCDGRLRSFVRTMTDLRSRPPRTWYEVVAICDTCDGETPVHMNRAPTEFQRTTGIARVFNARRLADPR